MALYKPGTLDDEAAIRRRLERTERSAREANLPTGSNVYETTDKVMNQDGNASEALAKANLALQEIDALPNAAGANIDITNRVISAPEMSVGAVDSICTLD